MHAWVAEGRAGPSLFQGLSPVKRQADEVQNKPVLRASSMELTARKILQSKAASVFSDWNIQ